MNKSIYIIFVLALFSSKISYCQKLAFDFYPGLPSGNPVHLIEHNGFLYLFANDTFSRQKIWNYSKSPIPVSIAVLQSNFTTRSGDMASFNGKLYVPGLEDSLIGFELYSYDTVLKLVADLDTGKKSSNPCNLTVGGNKLYFQTKDKIWEYDGISSPHVVNLNSTFSLISSAYLKYHQGKLFFTGVNNINIGPQFFEYDINTQICKVLKNSTFGANRHQVSSLISVGKKMYFLDDPYTTYMTFLFEYDADSGTIKKLSTPQIINPRSWIKSNIFYYKNAIYFSGALHQGDYFQLCKYDTLGDSTVLVSKINNTADAGINNMVVYNDNLYFNAIDSQHGNELWVFNGTNSKIVADINPGLNSSNPSNFYQFEGKLYFSANDSVHGNELYVLDTTGTDTTTGIVRKIASSNMYEVFPNPIANYICFKSISPDPIIHTLTIYNVQGQIVYSSQGNKDINNIQLNTSEWNNGNYYYKISNAGTIVQVGKILKE